MAPRAILRIAGADLALFCKHPLDLRWVDPSYSSFLSPGPASADCLHLSVHVEVGAAARPEGLRPVFDTGKPWAIWTDGESYWLTLNPHGCPGGELWTARISCDMEEATVYCGPKMVRGKGARAVVMTPLTYPLDQILLMYLLARHQGALVHAAGADIGGRGLVFLGRSGAGKSTLAARLAGRDGIRLLSDDRIALRKTGSRFLAYGTPWPGDQGAALNESTPLCGIYFLRHAEADEIVTLSPQEAAERLLPVTSIPWYDPGPMTRVIRFLDDLLAHVPAFDLRFRPGPGVVELLEKQLG